VRDEERQTPLRWGRMLACSVAGLVLIALTFAVAGKSSFDDVFVSLMIECAAALFLLALFFLLERGFTRQVTRTVVRQVQTEVVAPLEQQILGLNARIGDLQSQAEQRQSSQRSQHHQLVEALDEVTFDNVSKSLDEADRLKAVPRGTLLVQANPDPRGLWLDFSYGAPYRGGRKLSANLIRIGIYPAGRENLLTRDHEMWLPTEGLLDVGERISDWLRIHGYRQPNNQPDWTFAMKHLQRSLRAVLPDDAPLQGPLFRLVGDLSVVRQGIVHLDRGLVLDIADLPETPDYFAVKFGKQRPATEWQPPASPEGVEEADWEVAVKAARDIAEGVPGWFVSPPEGTEWVPAHSRVPD